MARESELRCSSYPSPTKGLFPSQDTCDFYVNGWLLHYCGLCIHFLFFRENFHSLTPPPRLLSPSCVFPVSVAYELFFLFMYYLQVKSPLDHVVEYGDLKPPLGNSGWKFGGQPISNRPHNDRHRPNILFLPLLIYPVR